MRKGRLFVFLLIVLFGLGLCAQQPQGSRPNFTGVWKLDRGRSTLAENPPDSVTLYIHQNDPDFHVRRTEVQHGKFSAWSVHGRTDGKTLEWKNREGIRRTHMYWQGSQLVLELKNDSKRGNLTVKYTLSDGGKTLIAHESDQDHEDKWVFTKSG
jgi:hypothetical protein